MDIRQITRVAALSISLTTLGLCVSVRAERTQSKFKPGDRVELQEGFDWVPGTVVGIDKDSGWVKVRLDQADLPKGIPANVRSHLQVRTIPAHNVRASRTAQASAPANEMPIRKWTDRSGKFSVDARYDSTKDDRVVLVKPDGKRVEVPIAKLSEEDGKYLHELSSAEKSPFQEVGGEAAAAAPTKKANWNGAKLVRPQTFKQWSFVPPTANRTAPAAASSADANVVLTEIPDSQVFFEKVEGVYASVDGSRAIVCRTRGEVSQEKAMFLEVVDVTKQQAGSLIPLPDTTTVLDVDPDANLVMYRPAVFGSGENGVLTIAKLDGGKLVPVQQWEPYAGEDFAPSRDIERAWFLGGNRLMTINGHGKALTIWDVESCKALINIPVAVSFDLQVSLSPDRQLLAVIMKEGIALIDLTAGKHVATVPTLGSEYKKVAIRGDNTRLAGVADEGVTVWNLADGKMMSEFCTNSLGHEPTLQWTGEYLLAGGQYLFDVERRILLWEYQNSPGAGVVSQLSNERLYAVTKPMGDSGDIVFNSTAIPNATVLEQARSLPSAAELLAVKPGDSVSIVVDIDPNVSLADAVQNSLNANVEPATGAENSGKVVVLNPKGAQKDVVRQILAASLTSAGLKVVDRADLVVKAICKPQPPQVIRINVDGRFPPRPQDIVERTITPHASYLEMSLKGEVIWKRGFIAQPSMTIWLQRGETLDQALERLTKPNVTLFTKVKFSPYVARPGNATPSGAYGVSQFTSQGLVDGKSWTSERGGSFE